MHHPFSSHSAMLSFPGHRREIVYEDRRVLPQALQLRVGHSDVGQLEKEGVDAVLGDLPLRFAEGRLVGVRIGAVVTLA